MVPTFKEDGTPTRQAGRGRPCKLQTSGRWPKNVKFRSADALLCPEEDALAVASGRFDDDPRPVLFDVFDPQADTTAVEAGGVIAEANGIGLHAHDPEGDAEACELFFVRVPCEDVQRL